MKNKNFGSKVVINTKPDSIFGGDVITLRNVTEIHYNYSSVLQINNFRVAFESDLHGTGCTYAINDIKEFETRLETELAEAF